MSDGFRYAGWFTIDVRMAGLLLIFAAAVAVLVVALHVRERKWHDYVLAGLAVFALVLVLAVVVTQSTGVFPAVRVETVFAVP